MNFKRFVAIHLDLCKQAAEISEKKGHDYSGAEDTFANIKACEVEKICSAEVAIFIRTGDKRARLKNLILKQKTPACEETVKDTIIDLINYYCILYAILLEKKEINNVETNESSA